MLKTGESNLPRAIVDAGEWEFAQNLLADIQQDCEGLFKAAILWHQLCNSIKWQENRLLVLPESPAVGDLEAHKKFLETSVDFGKRILQGLEDTGIELPAPYGISNLQNLLKKEVTSICGTIARRSPSKRVTLS